MTPETRIELDRTTRLAEGLYRAIEEKNIQEPLANHHIRNAVTGLRGIDLTEDTEDEIKELCKQTMERLKPFLHYLRLLQK